ncbi:MAG: malectin domain-containing carbohydrate-binding protein [Dehalococcoidia bacterium]
MTDSAGTTSWTYDSLDRLTQAAYTPTGREGRRRLRDASGHPWPHGQRRHGHQLLRPRQPHDGEHRRQFAHRPTLPAPLRVNAGGPASTDSAGRAWAADNGFAGGTTGSTTTAPANTQDPTLYQTERWGTFSYAFPVSTGTYTRHAQVRREGLVLRRPAGVQRGGRGDHRAGQLRHRGGGGARTRRWTAASP